MKTLIKTIAASMIIAGTVALTPEANAQVETQDKMEQKQGQDRVEIRATELPEEVTAKTRTGDYKDWNVSKAYKITDPKTREVSYELHFTNPQGVTEKRKFDKNGKEIDDK